MYVSMSLVCVRFLYVSVCASAIVYHLNDHSTFTPIFCHFGVVVYFHVSRVYTTCKLFTLMIMLSSGVLGLLTVRKGLRMPLSENYDLIPLFIKYSSIYLFHIHTLHCTHPDVQDTGCVSSDTTIKQNSRYLINALWHNFQILPLILFIYF